MNEAALSERLRALREPAPSNGFEERLQQALWREAVELRAERARGAGSLRRVRRFGGRVGLGVIIVCGATAAAAAAGGIWAVVAHSRRSAPEPAAPRAASEATAAKVSRVAAPAGPAAPPSAAEPALSAPPAPEPSATPARAADPASATRARENEKQRAADPLRHAGPDRSPPAALVPFELPARGSAERAAGTEGTAFDRPSRLERLQLPEARGAADHAEGRALPGLPARTARGSRPDRSASERGAAPRGLEIARERASEKAERGLERAREARERK